MSATNNPDETTVATDEEGAAAAPAPRKGYVVTGRAAHGRVGRLFRTLLEGREGRGGDDDGDGGDGGAPQPRRWVDASPYTGGASADGEGVVGHPPPVSFLWENAPRRETRSIRDALDCYSHLPHGILLDDKWALARLLGRPPKKENGVSGVADDDDDNPDLAVLESHCFRGAGFPAFARRAGLVTPPSGGDADAVASAPSQTINQDFQFEDLLLPLPSCPPPPAPSDLWVIKDAMSNGAGGIWIVDRSNVRGFLDDHYTPSPSTPVTAPSILEPALSSALHPAHRYVAQRYAWPPALYGGRKCHVRVYGLLTGDGRAYVHKRAFLHVANEPFMHERGKFQASVHITNCCANSHDAHKFVGEICADLDTPGPFSVRNDSAKDERGAEDGVDAILPLGDYLPSIAASVAALTRRSAAFVRGGAAIGGFEYLGLDFVLSSTERERIGHNNGDRLRRPVAYLLEANAPPSQDTATGLDHAEELHDEVISDLLRLWVFPNLGMTSTSSGKAASDQGRNFRVGWRCVYSPPGANKDDCLKSKDNLIVPSKAAILNRIRWAMFERRALKEEELLWKGSSCTKYNGSGLDTEEHNSGDCESRKGEWDWAVFDPDAFVAFARSQFPYFAESLMSNTALAERRTATNTAAGVNPLFFESGGGAQVPRAVSDAVSASLSRRDRSVAGTRAQRKARAALSSMLIDGTYGAGETDNQQSLDNVKSHLPIMGPNATSLLDSLARKICASGAVKRGDEIVIASENHLANVAPWLDVARVAGAKVRWWTVADANEKRKGDDYDDDSPTESCVLSELINEKTKVIAVSHASNILGMERDVKSICDLVHRTTNNRGQVIVDGVAAAPHLLSPGFQNMDGGPDWYVVSLHKLFGPHLGCLVGKRGRMVQLYQSMDATGCGETSSSDATLCKSWEMGTMNYEACCGAVGLKEYFDSLATHRRFGLGCSQASLITADNEHPEPASIEEEVPEPEKAGDRVRLSLEIGQIVASKTPSYPNIARCIQQVELRLINRLLGFLWGCPLVHIIQDSGQMKVTHESGALRSPIENETPQRIPIVCFVHVNIPSRDIVHHCRNHGLVCRACKFLSTSRLWEELAIEDDGVVRFSLAHYNTLEEIRRSVSILEMIDGWS